LWDTWAFLRWSDIAGVELNLTAASLVISGLLDALIFFAYVWLLEAALGATLGKVIIGIRVLHDDERNRLAASATRNALRIVDGLAFYLVGAMVASCSRLRQRVGDICAETIVVAEDFHAGIKAAAVLLWLAALAGAVWSIPRLCAGANAAHQPRYLGQVVAQLGRTDDSAYIRLDRLRIDIQLAPRRTAEPATPVPSPLPESR
jgi:RDD family